MRQPTVTIVQRGKADRFGRVKLYLSYAFNYKTNYISLGWKVKPAEWLKYEQKVAGKTLSGGANATRINADLSSRLSKAYETIVEMHSQNEYPSFEEFKRLFINDFQAKKVQAQSFSDLALTILKQEFEAQQISRATKDTYEVAVRKFEAVVGKVPFNGITRMTILSFKGELSKSNNPNLASQYTRNLSSVYNRVAKNLSLHNSKPFDSITYDLETMSPKKEMSKEEFEKLYQEFKKLPEKSKQFETLRRFLFMCLGLRFSDTNLIEKKHLLEFTDDAGKTYLAISKPAQKTKKAGILPILPESQEWLLRWRENGFIFDKIPYDTYRDRLKQITKILIGRELTSHFGRHYAGDFIINSDMDMEDVKAVLGISSTSVAEIYAKRKMEKTVRKYYQIVANKDTKKT